MKKLTSVASTTFGSLLVLCSACSSNSNGPGLEISSNGGTTGTGTAAGGSATIGGATNVGGNTTVGQGGGSPGSGGSGQTSGGSGQSLGGNAQTGGSNAQGGQTTSMGGTTNGGTSSTATGGKAAGGSSAGGAATGGANTATGGKAAGGSSAGGAATGGKAAGGSSAGGAATGGTAAGGTSAGGAATGGATTATGGATTAVGGAGNATTGPCDIYAAANTPCVAAYSMIRRLLSTYTGPLYSVRSGSSAQNTGTGGTVTDIAQTADGFADSATQDTICAGTICTVAKLYDQSGRGNHLTVAKKGLANGGANAALDDFESTATRGPLNVSGHKVYSLYTAAREGYRLAAVGAGLPRGTAAEGIYMLADGNHSGTACCFDFGNVTTNPTVYGVMNTLFFGTAYWGKGAGAGPWFMADFEAGVWAGGSVQGDPGWGSLEGAATSPANSANPSLKVPYAFGILKTTPTNYTLRMANAQTATSLTTAYSGALPKAMDNLGGIVLGVGGDNSNYSFGTFFEGAITAGAPSDATDAAVLANVQAAKYGQ